MKLLLINKNNQVLDLLNNKDKFIISDAEALHGVEIETSESDSPYTDGSEIDNIRALPRGIEFTLTLRGNIQQSLDFINSYVKSKQYVTLREINNGRDITIRGVVNIPPYNRMQRVCKLTMSIYCNKPYWQDLEEVVGVIDDIISLLYFPVAGQYFTPVGRPFGVVNTSLTKELINDGDTITGAIFTIAATGEVVNPQINCDSGEQIGNYMRLNITLKENDQVIISTVKGDKYITINGTDTYNGAPILSYLEFKGNDWLQLEQGTNTFTITVTSGKQNVYFNASYRRLYE